jgi:Zn-dependent peptidase ImmA (M78 family)/DNA-binding XRE family transcriptional regulator
MGKEVPVNKKILVWAREKAGFAVEDAAKYVDVSLEKFTAWESGSKLPTMSQLEKIAKFYCRPVITFFMSSPPIEESSLKDFRTMGGHYARFPSKFFSALKIKIEILHDTLKEIAESEIIEKKNYVGSVSISTPKLDVVKKLNELLAWDNNIRRMFHTPRELFDELRKRASKIGVLVVLKGDLGSRHSRVSAEEFRGICIADDVVPLIVINPNDYKSAWVFTLIHELVHILLGDSGISNDMTGGSVEREIFCNKLAGEFLVPSSILLKLAQGKNVDLKYIGVLAENFCVSRFVIARRLLDTRLISKESFNVINKKLSEELASHQKTRGPGQKSGGPDSNVLARFRIGEPVLNLIINASDDGLISYSQASVALGLNHSRFAAVLK